MDTLIIEWRKVFQPSVSATAVFLILAASLLIPGVSSAAVYGSDNYGSNPYSTGSGSSTAAIKSTTGGGGSWAEAATSNSKAPSTGPTSGTQGNASAKASRPTTKRREDWKLFVGAILVILAAVVHSSLPGNGTRIRDGRRFRFLNHPPSLHRQH